jgi:hypothetical protein
MRRINEALPCVSWLGLGRRYSFFVARYADSNAYRIAVGSEVFYARSE